MTVDDMPIVQPRQDQPDVVGQELVVLMARQSRSDLEALADGLASGQLTTVIEPAEAAPATSASALVASRVLVKVMGFSLLNLLWSF